MFESLTKQLVKVAHINLREEKHGEESVLALDIKMEFDAANDFLAYLNPELKRTLYDNGGPQGDLLPDESRPTHLRFPELGTLHWAGELTGVVIYFHGAKKSEDLELSGKVNNLKFTCKDGGTVSVQVRAQVLPTAAQASMAVPLLGKEIKVSISRTEEQQEPAPG